MPPSRPPPRSVTSSTAGVESRGAPRPLAPAGGEPRSNRGARLPAQRGRARLRPSGGERGVVAGARRERARARSGGLAAAAGRGSGPLAVQASARKRRKPLVR